MANTSFEATYMEHFSSVYRAVLLLTNDPGRAEDAAQEAFARALSRWERLQGQTWATAWIARTALNVAKRDLRKRPHPMSVRDESEDPQSEAVVRLDIQRALQSLPKRQREALILVGVLTVSVAEAARVMSCAEGTVKAHLFSARKRLRDLLPVGGGEDE
jgi:RNA polymerase sigma-70 factor (ECF subfamily)